MNTTTNPETCRSKWSIHKNSRLKALRDLYKQAQSGNDDEREAAWEELCDYGLSFDYVAPHTFNKQPEGYWRWQLSWGGPSDEFRIYGSLQRNGSIIPYRVEYAFLNWFDGAVRKLTAKEDAFIMQLVDMLFVDTEVASREYHAAMMGDD